MPTRWGAVSRQHQGHPKTSDHGHGSHRVLMMGHCTTLFHFISIHLLWYAWARTDSVKPIHTVLTHDLVVPKQIKNCLLILGQQLIKGLRVEPGRFDAFE